MTGPEKGYSRGPYRNGIKRREDIIRAATEIFAEFGYNGGSLRTIASAIGTTSASLLQHFGTKEGLLLAVLDQWSADTGRRNAHHLRGLDFFGSLRDVMKYHLTHRGLIELFLTMVAESSSESHPARDFIQQRYARVTESHVRHLNEACELGEIAPMDHAEMTIEIRTLFAVMDGLELQWLNDPQVDLVAMFNRHLDHTIERWKTPSMHGAVAATAERLVVRELLSPGQS